jgi:hypothetical protein
MAIAVDATTARNMADAESGAITVSHTTAGSDRYLLVGFLQGSSDYGLTFSSAPTYGAVSLGELANAVNVATNVRVWVYGLVAPSVGANNLAFTYSGASTGRTVIAVRSFTGINQGAPIGTIVSGSGSGGGVTVDVTSAVNELVVDMCLSRSGTTLTVGAGQTQRVNQESAVANQIGASSDEAGAGTVTMSWTIGTPDEWVSVGIPLKPSTESSTALGRSAQLNTTQGRPVQLRPAGINPFTFVR